MKWKQIVVYLVILVALAGYYFIETAHKEKAKEKEIESKKILDIKKDQIDGLKIIHRGEKTIYLTKKNDKWTINEPVKTDVDKFALDNFLNGLVNISAQKKLNIDKEEFSKFGLDKPSVSIEFKVGDKWRTFKIGDKNPTGDTYYASLDDKSEIYMIASFQQSSLNKKLFDLRDKRLFTLNRDKVDRIEVARNNTIIKVIKKKDDKWESPDAPNVPIKTEKVDSLLDSLTWLRARKFVQETDDKLEEYGLKEPSIQVVLAVQKDKSETLLIGKEKDKTERYAKIASRPGVVLISKSIITDLPKSISDLEDKNLLSFDTDEVTKVAINLGDKKYELAKVEDKWKWKGTQESEKEPDSLEVNSLLWKIKDIEHQGKARDESFKDLQIAGAISLWGKDSKFVGTLEWIKESENPEKSKPIVLVKKKETEEGEAYFLAKEDFNDLKDKIKTLLGDTNTKGKN